MSQNKAFSTPFILAVLCIYFSYFLHGISVITLAQNMSSLAEKFSTDNAGIAYLISGIGLGRLISILFFGVISDKFGRRAVILMAAVMYLLFFFGIPACPSLALAYCLAVCVGIANSALDTGGYPALMLSLDQILIPCAIRSLAARKPSSLLCRASQPSQRAPQLAIPVRLLSIKPPSLAIAM